MLAKRGLRMTVASENRPTISGKAISLHVGRRFGMFFRSRASLVDHRSTDKRTPHTTKWTHLKPARYSLAENRLSDNVGGVK
jgi:hypothetical protein